MKVRLSSGARRDLNGIWDYTARRWNETQAEHYVRRIATAFDDLASGSAMGRSAEDIRPGYFKLAIGSHFIFYRLAGPDVIEVVRILHQRMDVDRHF